MTAQEKQTLLNDLQTVTGIFQEFEQAYNMVVSLPEQKRAVYNEVNVPSQVKSVASTGSSIMVTVIAYVILILPSIFAAAIVASILRLAQHIGLVLLLAIVINAIGAKYLGGAIGSKLRAGGNKLQDTINQQIRSSNEAAGVHNAEVDRQIALAQQKCDAVRQRISQMDMSWYPPDYCFSNASTFFYSAINNGKCETLGEAAKLYDETLFRDQVLANQQEQIKLAYRQCILQGMTIAAIHSEGAATRQTIQEEGAATREAIWQSGEATRQTLRAEGSAMREQRDRIYNDFKNRFGR